MKPGRGELARTYHVANLGGAAGPDEDDVLASAGLELVGSATNSAQLPLVLCGEGQDSGGENEGAEELHVEKSWRFECVFNR